MFTANGKCRNDRDHVFLLHLPFADFGFSEKLSSFMLASKTRIILHCYSFHSFAKKTNFHMKCFALSIIFIMWFKAAWKWRIFLSKSLKGTCPAKLEKNNGFQLA